MELTKIVFDGVCIISALREESLSGSDTAHKKIWVSIITFIDYDL